MWAAVFVNLRPGIFFPITLLNTINSPFRLNCICGVLKYTRNFSRTSTEATGGKTLTEVQDELRTASLETENRNLE